MKILYITSLWGLYANSGAIQNLGYIKGIKECVGKENIDIMTIRWADELYDNKMLDAVEVNNVYYDRVKAIERYFSQGGKKCVESIIGKSKALKKFKKLLVETLYFPGVDKEWIKNFSKINFQEYDYIISSSDTKTAHFIGEKIKEKYPEIKWIQIWGDPWNTDLTLEKITQKIAKKYEKRILSKGDIVFYVSEPTQQQIQKLYPKLALKLHYIPRGYATTVLKSEKKKINNHLEIIYSGFLNCTRDIRNFIKALEIHNQNNDIKINVKIFGNIDEYSEQSVEGCEYVKLCGVTDYFSILNEYSKCDGLLYIGNPQGSSQIPGKLYDYLGTQNPILALIYDEQDETTKFLKNISNVTVAKNDVEEILKGFSIISKQHEEGSISPYEPFSSINIMQDMLKKSEVILSSN